MINLINHALLSEVILSVYFEKNTRNHMLMATALQNRPIWGQEPFVNLIILNLNFKNSPK